MEDKIILYTIDCPRCLVLEKKLNDKHISYEVCKDREMMKQEGFSMLPILSVNGRCLDFGKAVNWINTQER